MLYSYPRTIKSNDVKKGFSKVGGNEFDWIIVEKDEVEGCLSQGFYATPAEALKGGDSDETNETNANNEKENSVSEGGDPIDLNGLTLEEIKAKYTVEQLKEIAKSLDIKSYYNMREDTLIEKILEKV